MSGPFVLTRATFAGGQRYGFTWTGDNSSTWGHMRLATQMLLNLGLSGISFVGDDIGGFGGSPPPDLLTRWLEIGAFNPMYRNHSTLGSLPQEVWVHGPEQEAIRRRYIETRYRLLPYIYTLAEEASRTGLPAGRRCSSNSRATSRGWIASSCWDQASLWRHHRMENRSTDIRVAYPEGSCTTSGPAKRFLPQPRGPTIVEISDAVAAEENQPKFPVPQVLHPALDQLPVFVRGGAQFFPCSRLSKAQRKLPFGRWNCGCIPERTATVHCISTMGTPSDISPAIFSPGIYMRFQRQVDQHSVRCARGNIFAMVEIDRGCHLRLAVTKSRREVRK